MLNMVAPEASYVKISGPIFQNHNFLVGRTIGWKLLPAQELLQIVLDRSLFENLIISNWWSLEIVGHIEKDAP